MFCCCKTLYKVIINLENKKDVIDITSPKDISFLSKSKCCDKSVMIIAKLSNKANTNNIDEVTK